MGLPPIDLSAAQGGALVDQRCRKFFPPFGWYSGSVTAWNTRRALYRNSAADPAAVFLLVSHVLIGARVPLQSNV